MFSYVCTGKIVFIHTSKEEGLQLYFSAKIILFKKYLVKVSSPFVSLYINGKIYGYYCAWKIKEKKEKIKQCKINMLLLKKMRISSLNRIKSSW